MSKLPKKAGTNAIGKEDPKKKQAKNPGNAPSFTQGSNLRSVPISKAKSTSAQPQARFSLSDALASVSGTVGHGSQQVKGENIMVPPNIIDF
jgi:hypothetical protein